MQRNYIDYNNKLIIFIEESVNLKIRNKIRKGVIWQH